MVILKTRFDIRGKLMEDGWIYFTPHQRDILYPRTKEQTCPTGAEAEATGPTRQIQAPVEADRAEAPENAGPSLGPLRDALTPVRVKTPSELLQSSEALAAI